MIFTPHMLAGAVIGAKISQPWLILILGLATHYLLDAIPHWEYKVLNLKRREDRPFSARAYLKHLFKVILDLSIGLGLVIILAWKLARPDLIALGMIVAILPDGITFLYWTFKTKYLKPLYLFHKKIHPKGALSFWKGFPLQLLISLAAIAVLIFFS